MRIHVRIFNKDGSSYPCNLTFETIEEANAHCLATYSYKNIQKITANKIIIFDQKITPIGLIIDIPLQGVTRNNNIEDIL